MENISVRIKWINIKIQEVLDSLRNQINFTTGKFIQLGNKSWMIDQFSSIIKTIQFDNQLIWLDNESIWIDNKSILSAN